MESDAIIQGKSIAQFQIGWTFEELVAHFREEYNVEEYFPGKRINYKNFCFWIKNATQTVEQICVGGDFKGKFLNKIGIGSTLQDVEDKIGPWGEDLDVYILPEYKGICFELAEEGKDEEWIEKQMPIEYISIYEPKENE